MNALRVLVSSAMVLFLVGEVSALTVELPKEVSGKELVQIIQSEVAQIPVLRVEVEDDLLYIYKPGSVMQEVGGYYITVNYETIFVDIFLGNTKHPLIEGSEKLNIAAYSGEYFSVGSHSNT